MPGKPFCPNCGKETKTWGLCDECSQEMGEKEIELKVCPRCNYYSDRGKWIAFVSLEELSKDFASRGLSVTFRKAMCEPCRRLSSGYLEATIQLRSRNPNVYDLLVKKLDEQKARDRYAFYRQKARKEGMDFELGSKGAAKMVIRRLATFRLFIRKNFQVIGMRKGKRVTRDVYVIRDW